MNAKLAESKNPKQEQATAVDMYERDLEEPAWLSGFVSGALEKFRQLAP